MKPKERYFFYNDGDSEFCYELDFFLDESLSENRTFEIVGAKILYGGDFFFCDYHGEVGETNDCDKFCKGYEPRNGKNGRCRHHKNCYERNGNVYIVSNGKIIDK